MAEKLPLKPMRVFPKETFRAPRREPEGMLSLGVLSLVTFFAQAKKVIKKSIPRPRCGRYGYLRKIFLNIIFKKVLSSSVTRKLVPPSPLGKASSAMPPPLPRERQGLYKL